MFFVHEAQPGDGKIKDYAWLVKSVIKTCLITPTGLSSLQSGTWIINTLTCLYHFTCYHLSFILRLAIY
jgi:hypothetical protein